VAGPVQGKRRSEDMGEHSRGTSCDTSRPSDLMDDARCKKQKVLHGFQPALVLHKV
jgi:hypothetical protein